MPDPNLGNGMGAPLLVRCQGWIMNGIMVVDEGRAFVWNILILKTNMEDYIEAHKFSNNHMEQLKKDKICGCFYCLKIFSPSEIEDWLISEDETNLCDRYGTAICPYCCIDSVIGESSGYPITKEFLQKMKNHWF